MKDLSHAIINDIRQHHVQPVPRWACQARKIGTWSVFILMLLAGSLSFMLAVHLLQGLDWDREALLGYSGIPGFMLAAFPYPYAVLFLLFIVLAYFYFRRTPKGHRVGYGALAVGLLLTTGAICTTMHFTGLHARVHAKLSGLPYYHTVMFTKEKEWLQPQRGLLWGAVAGRSRDGFILEDIQGRRWEIVTDDLTHFDVAQDSLEGTQVKVIGQPGGRAVFIASRVMQWDGFMGCGHAGMTNATRRGCHLP